MATQQDLENAIQREHEQVTAGIRQIRAELQALRDQVANNVPISSADIDRMIQNVDRISDELNSPPPQP